MGEESNEFILKIRTSREKDMLDFWDIIENTWESWCIKCMEQIPPQINASYILKRLKNAQKAGGIKTT